MTQPNIPSVVEQPTLRQLNKATLLAVAAATVILVTAVLPAEYGVDPTGIGSALGLTPMGKMKQGQGSPAASVRSEPSTTSIRTLPDGGTEVRIVITGYGAREVKATMKASQSYVYRWSTDGPEVEFDMHGEPADGSAETTYEKGNSAGATGTLRAKFDGKHGWYWHNLTPLPVTITAVATGQFEKFAPIGE
jgi:hypothetical protein